MIHDDTWNLVQCPHTSFAFLKYTGKPQGYCRFSPDAYNKANIAVLQVTYNFWSLIAYTKLEPSSWDL